MCFQTNEKLYELMNESDLRSDVHYLGSSENKAWKKYRPVPSYILNCMNSIRLDSI